MPRTARKIGNSGFYHIVARGIGKQIIFEEENDYLLFLGLLKKYLKEEDAVLHAYCLMDNHFHLLLKIDSGMDRLMKKISTAYVFYFNNKYERVGHLFQDRYRSIPVEDDSSLLSGDLSCRPLPLEQLERLYGIFRSCQHGPGSQPARRSGWFSVFQPAGGWR